jgi:hypothetical protein
VVAAITPYGSTFARAVHLKRNVILSTEVVAHWHQHFRAEAGGGTVHYGAVSWRALRGALIVTKLSG